MLTSSHVVPWNLRYRGGGMSVRVAMPCAQVERRARQGPQRMLKIWRKDVRHGYRLMEQWQARSGRQGRLHMQGPL